MAKYESMHYFRQHLIRLDKLRPYSDSKVDDLIMALSIQPQTSAGIRRQLKSGYWDAIYKAIIEGFVETEYWKATKRSYWLTASGKSYMKFLEDTIQYPKSSELHSDVDTDSETDEPQGALFSETEEDCESDPAPEETSVTADLGATILNESQRGNVEALLAYYQCLLLADEINRSEGMFLVSVEMDHSVVQMNGNIKERVQMLELIKQLATQEQ